MLFHPRRKIGECAVKGEKTERGEEVEEDTNAEGAQKLHPQGRIRDNQGAPCQVEKQEVERSRIGGEGGDKEDWEAGDGEKGVERMAEDIIRVT